MENTVQSVMCWTAAVKSVFSRWKQDVWHSGDMCIISSGEARVSYGLWSSMY